MSPEDKDAAAAPAPKRRPDRKALFAVVAVVVVALIILGFVWMVQAGATGVVRDVFIVLLAVVSLFIGVMMLALVYQVAALTRMLREEIKPLLENVQETVNTARGTTQFMSEHVARPMIHVAGTVAGVARVISLLGDLRRPRR